MTTNQPQTTRIPNFFHLVLFLFLTVLSLIVCEIALGLLHPHNILNTLQNQRLQLFATIATYALTILAATFVFPLLWHRSFASGISFNSAQARPRLILAGLGLGLLSQATSTLLPIPKELPIEKVFQTPGIIWTLAVFGTLIAPLFEEIVFRGFLLPALANAIDYMRIPQIARPRSSRSKASTPGALARHASQQPPSPSPPSSPASLFALHARAAARLHVLDPRGPASAIGLLIAVSLDPLLSSASAPTRSPPASLVAHAATTYPSS